MQKPKNQEPESTFIPKITSIKHKAEKQKAGLAKGKSPKMQPFLPIVIQHPNTSLLHPSPYDRVKLSKRLTPTVRQNYLFLKP